MRLIERDLPFRGGSDVVCDAARSERVEAISLRRDGATYSALQQRFGIAKSTLWRWLKAEGLVETEPQRLTELKRRAQQKGAAAVRAQYVARTRAIVEAARQEVDALSRRDLWLLGVALYWAEGTKQKPHNVAQRVAFANSDPRMACLFMKWLRDVCLIPVRQLTFEIFIHESADCEAARRFWASTLQLPSERFILRLKRHRLSPHRRNIGAAYVGLVRMTVARSAALNRRIAGWIEGIVQGIGESANGKPSDFGSEYPGSIPGSPAV